MLIPSTPAELVRFPHDSDPWALWMVLRREGDHLLVRQYGVRRSSKRRRLATLAVPADNRVAA